MKSINYNIPFEYEKVLFESVKTAIYSEQCLRDIQAIGFEYYVDEYNRTIKKRLLTEYYERFSETKTIEVECKRPKFIEWLLRRGKKELIIINVKEVLTNPAQYKNSTPYIEIVRQIIEEPNK